MILKGEIVTLRPITTEDAEITLKWRLSDRAKLMQRGAQNVEEQRAWINSKLTTSEVNCIIEYKDFPVGMISLHDICKIHNHLIIGRLLIGEKEFVGKAPVAYEAELLLCDYAFRKLGIHKIYGDVVGTNSAMLKFRNYLGYKEDGVMRDHLSFDGKYINAHTFSLLDSEYEKICRPRLLQLITLMSNYS